jgi:serine/threonine protein kinase
MNAPYSKTLSRLLDSALNLPKDQRLRWVDNLGAAFAHTKPQLRALVARSCAAESSQALRTLPKLQALRTLPNRVEVTAQVAGKCEGPYRLVRPLGSGAMGTVWLAEAIDARQPRRVALKCALRGSQRPDLEARLMRERYFLSVLEHPNIVALHSHGVTQEGQPYLALEYVEGSMLEEHCRARQCDTRARIGLFAQLASAVAHAHDRRIVHRDLKPANVIVTSEGVVRLLDFGIAKQLRKAPKDSGLSLQTGRPLTPAYASPEQLRGEIAERASDVYSLGVVLFELLTGARPYASRAGSRRELKEAVLTGAPPPPSSRRIDHVLSESTWVELDAIVARCLEKRCEDRYDTARELCSALERLRLSCSRLERAAE